MVAHVDAEACAAGEALLIRGHEMDAAEDAADAGFRSGFGEGVESVRESGHRIRGGGKRDFIRAEERGEDRRLGAAEGAVAGGVFGEGRGIEQRGLRGVFFGRGIFVGVGLADGGDRTPEIAVVFAVPTKDRGVREGNIQHG